MLETELLDGNRCKVRKIYRCSERGNKIVWVAEEETEDCGILIMNSPGQGVSHIRFMLKSFSVCFCFCSQGTQIELSIGVIFGISTMAGEKNKPWDIKSIQGYKKPLLSLCLWLMAFKARHTKNNFKVMQKGLKQTNLNDYKNNYTYSMKLNLHTWGHDITVVLDLETLCLPNERAVCQMIMELPCWRPHQTQPCNVKALMVDQHLDHCRDT